MGREKKKRRGKEKGDVSKLYLYGDGVPEIKTEGEDGAQTVIVEVPVEKPPSVVASTISAVYGSISCGSAFICGLSIIYPMVVQLNKARKTPLQYDDVASGVWAWVGCSIAYPTLALSIILGITAIIAGIIALVSISKMKEKDEEQIIRGSSRAKTGIVMGAIGIVAGILCGIIMITWVVMYH